MTKTKTICTRRKCEMLKRKREREKERTPKLKKLTKSKVSKDFERLGKIQKKKKKEKMLFHFKSNLGIFGIFKKILSSNNII